MANPQLKNGYIRIANNIYDALVKTRISGEARQMLDLIIRNTYGWNKPKDRISTSQIIKATGLSRSAIQKVRKKLVEMNLISISKNGYTKGLTYSFVKDYEKWKVYPKKDTVSKLGSGCIPKRIQKCIPKCIPQKTYKDIYTKDILHSLRLEYVRLKSLNIKHFTSDHYARTGKALKTLLTNANGSLDTVRAALGWVARQDYIDWTLETVIKKWPDFMKFHDQPEILKKYGGNNATRYPTQSIK